MKIKLEIEEYSTDTYHLEIDYQDGNYEDFWYFILRNHDMDELARGKDYSKEDIWNAAFKKLAEIIEAGRK